MNVRSITKDHIKGIVLGFITPLVFAPLVLLIISWMQDYDYSYLWHKFTLNTPYRIKIITLAIIANLIWFYFFLNRERYNHAKGIIIGSMLYAPYIIYIKFF